MKKNNVLEFAGRDTISDPLTDLLRSGAQQLINQAVEAELQELLIRHSCRRTVDGNAVVVRNGHLPERELQTGLGPVTVRIPKVRSRTGEPVTFRSALVPPYVRKTRSLEAALPWLYLKGISTDISQMTSKTVEIISSFHRQDKYIPSAARLPSRLSIIHAAWRDSLKRCCVGISSHSLTL